MGVCNNCDENIYNREHIYRFNCCVICEFTICSICIDKLCGFHTYDLFGNYAWICSNKCILMNPEYINNKKSKYLDSSSILIGQFDCVIRQQQTIQNQIEKNNIRSLLCRHIINDLLNIVNEYIFTE